MEPEDKKLVRKLIFGQALPDDDSMTPEEIQDEFTLLNTGKAPMRMIRGRRRSPTLRRHGRDGGFRRQSF